MSSFPAQGVPQLIQILDSIVYFCCIHARDCKQRSPANWPAELVATIQRKVMRRHGVHLLDSTILKRLVENAPMDFVFQGWREWCKQALEILEKQEDKDWNEWGEKQEGSWKGGPVPILCSPDQIRIGGRKAKTLEELQQAREATEASKVKGEK
jgi:hypothetical protein